MNIRKVINRIRYRPWKRDIKFFWQRQTRGWDDGETFSLDYSLGKLIAPRLKRLRDITSSHPSDIESQEWRDKLDKMIAAFEFAGSDKRWNANPTEYEKYREGLDLFAKNYWSLWW